MGTSYDVICKNCGKHYTASFGPGMLYELLHCDRCGKEKIFDHDVTFRIHAGELDENSPELKCRCGGTFSTEAPPRCPKCKSAEYDRDPLGVVTDYD